MTMVDFSTPLLALDAVVLDTETTSLDARAARIIQIGAVRVKNGAIDPAERLDILVDPGQPIPPTTIKVHGITDAMVAGQAKFKEAASRLADFVGARPVIGHTIAYDTTVLQREYALAGLAYPKWRTLDVRHLARVATPELADHGLDRLCEWLGIENAARHNALGDAVATAEVYLALIPRLRAANVRTFAEAVAQIRQHAERQAQETSLADVTEIESPASVAAISRIDSFAYRHTVGDLMSAPPLFLPPSTGVMDAIRFILDKGVSSAFVRREDGVVGIVTERDLLRAVVGADATATGPIVSIMKAPLQTVAADDYLYRAIGRIQRLGFRHLGVRSASGEIVGAVTTRNLLRHRSTPALMFGDEIDSATTGAQLATAWSKVPKVAASLAADEVDPRTISAVVSTEIGAMTRRAAELAEAEMIAKGHGAPPVPYCVLVLGSAGRGESQLAPDQDNAIIYGSGRSGGPEDAYFRVLAERMNTLLDEGGIPFCKGGVMARNPQWRKSVTEWKETVDGWVRRQRGEDLLSVDICFDAAPVHGEASFGEEIWRYAYERAHRAKDLQVMLTESARQRGSPYTLLGNLRLDADGRIDLKKHGLMTIFGAARVLSIRHAAIARSTRERLRACAAMAAVSDGVATTIEDAHRTLLGFVIAQQLVDLEAGIPPTVRVKAARLSSAQKTDLKEAFRGVDEAAGALAEGRI